MLVQRDNLHSIQAQQELNNVYLMRRIHHSVRTVERNHLMFGDFIQTAASERARTLEQNHRHPHTQVRANTDTSPHLMGHTQGLSRVPAFPTSSVSASDSESASRCDSTTTGHVARAPQPRRLTPARR